MSRVFVDNKRTIVITEVFYDNDHIDWDAGGSRQKWDIGTNLKEGWAYNPRIQRPSCEQEIGLMYKTCRNWTYKLGGMEGGGVEGGAVTWYITKMWSTIIYHNTIVIT